MISAFGVEHGSEISKGLRSFLRLAKPAKKAEEVRLSFKPIKSGVNPTGPGSLRGRMDQSAHETRLAAKRRENK